MRSRIAVLLLLIIVTSVLYEGGTSLVHSQVNWKRVGQTSFTGGFGQAMASDGDDIFIIRQFRAGTSIDFARYSISDMQVGRSSSLPVPPHDVKNGTVMVFSPDGDLYLMFGGAYDDRRDFFYRLSNRVWEQLDNTPFYQGAGDAMTYVEIDGKPFLYAIVGAATSQRPGATTAFLSYDVLADHWGVERDPPWFCSDDGSSLSWDGGEFVYAFAGSTCNDGNTSEFARYSLMTEQWESRERVPNTVDDGGSLVWDGDRYIYATTGTDTKGQGTGFYRFDLTNQIWDTSLAELTCSVGNYNGNRIVIIQDQIFNWQGAPSTWNDTTECDGTGIYLLLNDELNSQAPSTESSNEGRIFINEIEQNPDGTDSGNEWVELYNPSSESVDVGGWEIRATHGRQASIFVTNGSSVPAGGFLVLQADRQSLDNEDEVIELYNTNGNLIDTTPPSGLDDTQNDGRCWARVPDATAQWLFQACTRGASNGN